MLNENIRALRKAKGLSQEDLAVRLNVVRQTVSKWEQGLSVPDADLLIALSETLGTPVSVLLGESVTEPAAEPSADDVRALAEKLETVNLLLARQKERRRKWLRGGFIALAALVVLVGLLLLLAGSPYLDWDLTDPETAVAGTMLHAFEFIFVRLAPFLLIGAVAGIILTRKQS